ncbi:MAG: hypothetical protein H7A23_04165 [Leptospiraceae bacterium]|nr:hypothetical protein [Leptospiraceae bacterium]MCP5493727.1 hypothetical protein [Leptospiraceae bacterium]
MPFFISGNIDKIEPYSLRKFSKQFGLILSPKQSRKDQLKMLQSAVKNFNFKQTITKLNKSELLSFIFLLTQFGDVAIEEIPEDYSELQNNPYALEWEKGHFMIPLEILEFLSTEKTFKNQNYLFSLLASLSIKEKKAWIKWLGVDYEGESENKLAHEIYYRCRILQQKTKGRSLITESEIPLENLWEKGSKDFMDWFYQGLTPFYYAIYELSLVETDAYTLQLIEEIKSGKFIIKKLSEKFGEDEKYTLVKTVEGKTPQIRKIVYNWELERENKNSLFSTQQMEIYL